jgi:hypothetical protein
MKKILFLLLISTQGFSSIAPYYQYDVDYFHLIGGYTYTQNTFSNGPQTNPFVVSGPYPQNSFSYVVSSAGGIKNVNNSISTASVATSITIEFKGNNVRKFGCRALPVIFSNPVLSNNDFINFTATSNLGNQVSLSGGVHNVFVGFNVTEENEYLTKIEAHLSSSSPTIVTAITLKNIIVGDNQKQNVALHFDGLDDYAEIPNNVGNFETYNDFTVTCWIKPNSSQTSSGISPSENDILSKWAGLDAGVNNNYPFVIRYLNDSRTNAAERGRILAGQWDGTTFPTVVSTTRVDDGRWHHVAFVKTGGIFKLYIDGNQEGGDVSDLAHNNTVNSTPLQIGRRGNGQNYFNGEIDEVRIWTVAKSREIIQNEMFCKSPNLASLQAAYDFGNGSPNGNNALITKIKDISSFGNNNDGELSNGFNLSGDVSNFVTGQVKYVKLIGAFFNGHGGSWADPFIYLYNALVPKPCNDLFDVYVSGGYTDPEDKQPVNVGIVNSSKAKVSQIRDASTIFDFFSIPSGMRIYGGFAGNEKNINERNPQEIFGLNQTTLSGDLGVNDIQFNFNSNREDNTDYVLKMENSSNTVFDGFMVKGGYFSGLRIDNSSNIKINNCRFIDNYATSNGALLISQSSIAVTNSIFAGNGSLGIKNLAIAGQENTFNNCLITTNRGGGIATSSEANGISNVRLTHCTVASNLGIGVSNNANNAATHINNYVSNSIIHGNGVGLSQGGPGVVFESLGFSFIQGISSGYNMIDGTLYDPQFVQPVSVINIQSIGIGNYRLKWCSKAIDAGTNDGVGPTDLDIKERAFNGVPDIGTYEFFGNTPNSQSANHIMGLINSSTYQGTANQTLTSDAKILAPAAVVDFNAANSITLNPGFEVRGIGQYFKAQIGGNVACNN